MRPNNLWGNIPTGSEIRTPFVILKEQADILSQMTNGLLIGEAKRSIRPDSLISIILRVRVPALAGYSYSILHVIYPPELYPLTIKDLTGADQEFECSSERQFEQALRSILSSEPVMRVISTLLADVRAELSPHEILQDEF